VDPLHLEQLLVLPRQRVLGLAQDPHQRLLVELLERRDHGQPADELGDEPELQQVLGLHLFQQSTHRALVAPTDVGAEPHALHADAAPDDVVEPDERAAADEEDVRGVDLEELLLRVLAAALRRHAGGGPFDDLEESLLDPLARDVTRDRGVVPLARDLVDLVDVDDAALALLDVVVGILEQREDDVLDVLTHVARLGEAGGIGDRERHLEEACQRLGQERLARPRGTDQQDVGLLQLDVARDQLGIDALVVVVHRDGEDLLRTLLADDVLIEDLLDLRRLRHRRRRGQGLFLVAFLGDDVVAEIDALVADVDRRPRDQLAHLVLALAAERADEIARPVIPVLCHRRPLRPSSSRDGSR
jgi:hypothetical protein